MINIHNTYNNIFSTYVQNIINEIKQYNPYFSISDVVNFAKARKEVESMSMYPFVMALGNTPWHIEGGHGDRYKYHINMQVEIELDIKSLIPDVVDVHMKKDNDGYLYNVNCTTHERADELVEEIAYIEMVLNPEREKSPYDEIILESYSHSNNIIKASRFKLYYKWRSIFLYNRIDPIDVTEDLVNELKKILQKEKDIAEEKRNASKSYAYKVYRILEGRDWSVEHHDSTNGYLILDDRSISLKNLKKVLPKDIYIKEITTDNSSSIDVNITSDRMSEFVRDLERLELLFHPIRTFFPWDLCVSHNI